MRSDEKVAKTIDEYVGWQPPAVRAILERIRKTIRAAVPEVEEGISYRMPVFRAGGVLAYVGAFKEHIGVFPPFSGDRALERELAPYAGEKGNLRFRYDQPMRYDLIERIVTHRARQNRAKSAGRRKRRSGA